MVTRVPPHEIGKVQGDSTNRNHLAKKSKFICPIRPEAKQSLFSVMAPCADVMIYFIDLFHRLPIDQDNSSSPHVNASRS